MIPTDDLPGAPLAAMAQPAPRPSRSGWLPILMLVLLALALLACLGATILLVGLQAAGGLAGAGSQPLAGEDPTLLLSAASALLVALALAPGVAYALAAAFDRPAPAFLNRLTAWLRRYGIWGLPLWAVVVALGAFLSGKIAGGTVLLAALHPLAVGLPVLALLSLAARGISFQGPGRGWSLFGYAAAYNTAMMIVIELVVAGGLVFAFAGILMAGSDLATQLPLLAQRMVNAGSDPEAMLRIVRPLLARPAVIYAAGALFSGVTPLLEEVLKALPVFLLLTVRRITPAQGFVAGALSGGAMALIESLGFSTSSLATSWAQVVLQRAGTDLLHITTTALVGWALASAIAERRYLRLAFALLAAVAIHGSWNALALLPLAGEVGQGAAIEVISGASRYAMAALGLGILVLFIGLQRANRAAAATSAGAAATGDVAGG